MFCVLQIAVGDTSALHFLEILGLRNLIAYVTGYHYSPCMQELLGESKVQILDEYTEGALNQTLQEVDLYFAFSHNAEVAKQVSDDLPPSSPQFLQGAKEHILLSYC